MAYLIGLTLKKADWLVHKVVHAGFGTHRHKNIDNWIALVNNTSLKQQATVEVPFSSFLPLHHTRLGKTADEKYHPRTSPHAEII